MDEKILQAIAQLTSDIQANAQAVKDGLANRDEELKKVTERLAGIEAATQAARHAMPGSAPLGIGDVETGDAMAAKAGWRTLPYQKALDLPTSHPILRPTDREQLVMLHDYHDAVAIKLAILKQKGRDESTAWRQLLNDVDFKTWASLAERAGFYKANEIMNPAGLTNLDFTLVSSTLIQKFVLDLRIGAQFQSVQLTRHSQKVPTQTAYAMGVWGKTTIPARSAGSGGVNTTPLPPFSSPNYWSALSFGSVQFDVEHLLTFLIWNDDMLEDSIIPWLPMMRDQAAYGGARAWDNALLNGDSAASDGAHMDTDHDSKTGTGGANDFCQAVTGLRKFSKNNWLLNGSGYTGAAFGRSDFEELRKSLGIYGLNVDELFCVMPIKVYYDLVTSTEVMTVDKFGPQATIHNGVLAKLYGIDIVVSEFARTDTNMTSGHSGTNYTSANTAAVVGMANRRRFAQGMFGSTQIEQTRIAPWLTDVIQADLRCDFRPWDATGLTSEMFDAGTDQPVNFMVNNTNA